MHDFERLKLKHFNDLESTMHSTHHQVSLEYTLPTPHLDKPLTLPREIQLSRNLKISGEPQSKKPTYSNTPITPQAHRLRNYDEPLADVLTKSRQIIKSHNLQLTPLSTSTVPQRRKSIRIGNDELLINDTPIPNKTVVFGPRVRHQAASTPQNSSKEAQLRKHQLFLNLLKSKRLLRFDNGVADELINYYDLACHVLGILKMAVDLTMLDGLFLLNESSFFHGRVQGEDSVLATLRKGTSKVEITMADITAAVEG